ARAGYEALGDTRQDEVLSAFGSRAKRGIAAAELLATAQRQAEALRYIEARAAADQAAAELDALGDSARASQARLLRYTLDSRQTLLGVTLLTLGMLGIAGSLWGRWMTREAEVW